MGEKKKPEDWTESVASEFRLMKTRNEKMEKVFGWISSEDVQRSIYSSIFDYLSEIPQHLRH